MPVNGHDLWLILPFILLLAAGALAIVADMFIGRNERAAIPFVSLGGVVAAACTLVSQWGANEDAFGGTIRVDDFSIVLGLAALGATALSVLMSISYVRAAKVDFGEFYALMLTACAGALLLAQANDLIGIFLSIEILSISVYCLTGITRDREKSSEGAMKYFIMGAFSTGFMLYGIALLYGASVSTSALASAGPAAGDAASLRLSTLAHIPTGNGLFLAGTALFLIGILFKIGAVPFHAWTPDAYEGAPAPVTGFMAATVKAGAFAALLRAALIAFPALAHEWSTLLALLAAATMVVGNLFALAQTNFKRLLAYSSIGHTGYLLIGVVVSGLSPTASAGVLYYVIAYAIMTVGSFGLVSLLSREGGEVEDIPQFNGLASRRPGLAAALTVFMASLAGIPPTAGFMGKLLIFREAIRFDYTWLALIGIATSMLSAYYYLKIVVAMYMREPEKGEEFALSSDRWGAGLALAAAAAGTILIGLLPSRFIEWSLAGVRSLL